MKTRLKNQKNITNLLWLTLIVLATTLLWESCSIVGFVIGSKTKKKGEDNIAGWQIERINIGDRVRMIFNNSDTISGEFKGIELNSIENYTIFYQEARQDLANVLDLPEMGAEVSLSFSNTYNYNSSSSKEALYYFEGFGYNTIFVRDKNNKHQTLSLISDSKLKLANGSIINKELIFNKLKENVIPVRTNLLILDDIAVLKKINPMTLNGPITVFKKGRYGVEGFAIGAVADIIILFAVIAPALEGGIGFSGGGNMWGESQGSCPMVYSYDGKNYKLDSEPFGGSIYKAAQRTDVDKLEYLQADEGFYRFKLANELDETQYVDEFKLMAVDHSEQFSLLPSFDGKIHTFSQMTAPVSAIDQNGNEVLDKVNKKDDNYWVSYPFNRSAEVNGDERDALILEFEKPAGAEQVKLAFNVQNTIWAASLQKELISMQGSSINEWYAHMEKSPEARSLFTEAMIREGMLLVKEWTGSEWKTRDYVWEVGPAIPKDQAMVIKILPNDNPRLRIKLESTVGLWMINSVFADFEQQETFTITELSPVKAESQDGRNVLDLITKEDGTYYEMPNKTDWALIEFKSLPKPAKGFIRSYFLKCGGYYHIHTDNSIEPNQQLIRELIAKPGAYGKYTLKSLNDKLSSVIE